MRYKTILLLALSAWGIMACQNYTDSTELFSIQTDTQQYKLNNMAKRIPILLAAMT